VKWTVLFRRLIEGSKLLNKLEKVPTENERPIYDCRIQECGIYSPVSWRQSHALLYNARKHIRKISKNA